MTMLRQPERFCLETTPSTVCGMTQRLLVQISNTRTRKNRRQAKLNSWRQDPRQHAALATRRRGCNATTNWWDPRTNVSRGYAHSAAAATVDYEDDDDDDDDDDDEMMMMVMLLVGVATGCAVGLMNTHKLRRGRPLYPRRHIAASDKCNNHSTARTCRHRCMVLRTAAASVLL